MNTLQTSLVVVALLRASQRQPAACLADNFVSSCMQSANAVILGKTILLSAIFAGRAFRHVPLWARGRETVCRW